jgi:hypothetical protein
MKKFFKPEMTIELLQEFQKDAKIEQSESFQEYKRKAENDPTIVINSEWPYQTKETNAV